MNDARELSIQSSYESFLPLFTTSQNGVDLIVHSCGILHSFGSISFERFMVDLEAISMIRYFLNDLDFSDKTVSIDLFKKVGPGGIFLSSSDTLKKCRTVPWKPTISHRGALPEGIGFQEQLLENIKAEKNRLLSAYVLPELDKEAVKELDVYLRNIGFDDQLIEKLKPKVG